MVEENLVIRKAVIDLGTNTFNLLIADVSLRAFQVVHSEKEGVALGMGGINSNQIAPDAFERGLRALSHFQSVCKKFSVDHILAIGTSALRDAKNSTDFIVAVQSNFPIHINIISGEKEAELIFQGVKWTHDFKCSSVIMDIGGGSTEFIFVNNQKIYDLISLNIGVSRIYQEFQPSDPLSLSDIQNIENWLENKSNGFFVHKEVEHLVGASGSFETFYELIHNQEFPLISTSLEISLQELMNCLEKIIFSTQKERDQNNRIIPIRKKMAPIAAVKTAWILKKLSVKKVFISPFSLKEGVIIDHLYNS